MALHGHLDSVDGLVLAGWAWDSTSPSAAAIEILVDHVVVAQIHANEFREDLAEAGYGAGDHAFWYELPSHFADGRVHALLVRHRVSGAALHGGRRRVGPIGEPALGIPAVPPTYVADRPVQEAVAELSQHGRVAIVAMHTPGARLWAYQRLLLGAMRDLGYRVILVHNGIENAAALHRDAGSLTSLCIARQNIGLDFAAWRLAISCLWPTFDRVRDLVLINDSVFGPLTPLAGAFEAMQSRDADFWGITDSWEQGYHLQSYFLAFRHRALAHPAFRRFWETYGSPANKKRVIAEGEIRLSRALINGGLTAAALCPYAEVALAWLVTARERVAETKARLLQHDHSLRDASELADQRAFDRDNAVIACLASGKPVNPAAFFWDTLITEWRCPFVKRELFMKNPTDDPDPARFTDLLVRLTDFPVEHIEEVRRQTDHPLGPPLGLPGAPTVKDSATLRLARGSRPGR
jgi:hypothetical protein